MKQFRFLCLVIVVTVLFTSCDKMVGGLMTASSAANEIMVVMERDAWEGEAGDALFAVLNSRTQGLMQFEPNFRTLHITPDNFTRSFRTVRNVIIPNISNIYIEPRLRAELNVYAIGQVIMNINAPDTATFIQFVTEHERDIVEYFLDKELTRNAQWMLNNSRMGYWNIAREMFGVNVIPPRGLRHMMQEENFVWITNNAARARQDFVMYQFPYVNEEVFNANTLIAIRNEILGEHIHGMFPNSVMRTQTTIYPPYFRTLAVNSEFRAEIRGLWELSGEFMGGPFVMHAFVNENTGMVVVAEVFTYSPEAQTSTRNLIRSSEASLYTISIVN